MLHLTTTLVGLGLCALPAALQEGHPYENDSLREPRMEVGRSCLIRGATVHDAIAPARVTDVLVVGGKIAAIGDLQPGAGTFVIEAAGKHLAPGIVDCHSHMAIERGVNEGSLSITAEVTMKDVVNPDDVGIYRALAGGVTTIRLLHGSANPIGGRDEVLKLRWHVTEDELRFPNSEQGIKFALGENPKRSNGSRGTTRFPGSRMGVEATYYRAFERAAEYMREWEAYHGALDAGDDPEPPRKDIRLDVLAGILEQEVIVHSHCYRADEILMLIRASQHFGFRIGSLQHVLEGYKVAFEMADAAIPGSAFSDWWAYKVEAYDAIPHCAALMAEAGVLSSINSDSGEMIRRLYDEAAKSVRYAGMDPVEALKLVTLNPALQLGIGDRVGSIEVGKDADLALLNGDPLSAFARVELTMVDGVVEFERRDAFALDGGSVAVTAISESARSLDGVDREAPITALVGGTLHTVTGADYENGTLLIQDGHILALGTAVEVPEGAEVIDCSGLDVWPGMIALASSTGLYEIGAVRSTIDSADIGGNQPDLRTTASIHAASAHVGVTRHNGITRAQSAPQGGGPIRGQSAIVRLAGDTWEEMLTVDRDMLHISFPRTSNSSEEKEKKSETLKELEGVFRAALEYARLVDESEIHGVPRPPHDPRLAALAPFARGGSKVGLHVSNAQTILFALRFIEELELDAVLFGAGEAWKVVDRLAAAQVPVVVGPVWSVPRSEYDPYDAAFANAAVLQRAGVPFAIMTSDTDNERNLPFQAATAVAYGLPPLEGVRAVTYYPARILGIEDRLGSLAVGKLADVVVTRGHLLEIAAPVEHLFIEGALVDHRADKHSQLYEYYRARLHRLQGR